MLAFAMASSLATFLYGGRLTYLRSSSVLSMRRRLGLWLMRDATGLLLFGIPLHGCGFILVLKIIMLIGSRHT